MENKVIKKFESCGFKAVIIDCDGHLCGYVGINENHPLHKMDYSNEQFPDFDVHGGITWSGELGLVKDGLWYIGFDCAHYGDKTRVSGSGIYRDEEYVTNEINNLADQINRVVKKERTQFYYEVE